MSVKSTPPLIFAYIKGLHWRTIQVTVLNDCGWHGKWFADITLDWKKYPFIRYRKINAYYERCPCAMYDVTYTRKGSSFDKK